MLMPVSMTSLFFLKLWAYGRLYTSRACMYVTTRLRALTTGTRTPCEFHIIAMYIALGQRKARGWVFFVCDYWKLQFHGVFWTLLDADVFTGSRIGGMWRWVQRRSAKHDRLVDAAEWLTSWVVRFVLVAHHWRGGALPYGGWTSTANFLSVTSVVWFVVGSD